MSEKQPSRYVPPTKSYITFNYNFDKLTLFLGTTEELYAKQVNILEWQVQVARRDLPQLERQMNEFLEKSKLGKYLMDLFVMLTHANLDHNVAHNLYKGLLELRELLFRLLGILGISILFFIMTVTTNSVGMSDLFNTPLVLILIAWVLYLLCYLGISIKKFTRLEDEFLRIEKETEVK